MLYTEADFTFNGTASVSGTDAGTYPMTLASGDFENTNDNFANVTFNIVNGQLVIKPIDVTVELHGNNSTVDYDGEEHTVTGYTVDNINSELYTAADFALASNVVASASRTDAGTTNMGLTNTSFVNNNTNFDEVTFIVTDGYQKINPIDVTVTITEHSDTVNYDGEVHTVTGYDVAISNLLYTEADFSFDGSASVSGTDAGTYPMNLASDNFENRNNNFANVTFNIEDGQLVIKKINAVVTVTEKSAEMDYDGQPHTISGYASMISSTQLYDVTTSVQVTERSWLPITPRVVRLTPQRPSRFMMHLHQR